MVVRLVCNEVTRVRFTAGPLKHDEVQEFLLSGVEAETPMIQVENSLSLKASFIYLLNKTSKICLK